MWVPGEFLGGDCQVKCSDASQNRIRTIPSPPLTCLLELRFLPTLALKVDPLFCLPSSINKVASFRISCTVANMNLEIDLHYTMRQVYSGSDLAENHT